MIMSKLLPIDRSQSYDIFLIKLDFDDELDDKLSLKLLLKEFFECLFADIDCKSLINN